MERKLGKSGKPLVDVLWTGGWDSTYRVLRLARLDVEIQPRYVRYPHRRSAPIELATIKTLTDMIRADKNTIAVLNDLAITDYADIPPCEEITAAFKSIKDRMPIGPQYEYLARFSKDIPGLEIGIELGGHYALGVMTTLSKLVKTVDEYGVDYWYVDKEHSDPAMNIIFGSYHLPLFDVTKADMHRWGEAEGMLYIMDKTWFCHYPVGSKPCGTCFPCNYTIEDGLEYRLPKSAMRRHRFEQKHKDKKWYQNFKRLRRKYLKY